MLHRSTTLMTAVVLGLLEPHAFAQSSVMTQGVYSDQSSFQPTLSASDLKIVVRVLGLGKPETQAVEDLYQGYAVALRTEGGEVRDFVNGEIERAQAMQNVGLLEPARKRVNQWETRSEQLRKSFLEDLKSLLSRDEEARWPIVERELRRIKHIGDGRLAGESVDLVRLTEDALGGPPSGELAELLNRYSGEIDHALVARERFLEEKNTAFREAIKNDLGAAKAMWDEAQRVRGAVRDINDRYSRQIGEQLPVGVRAKFQRQVFDLSYPALIHPTLADGYLKDVGELDSLTGEQRSRFTTIKTKYESDRAALLARGAAAWRQFEPDNKPEALVVGERPADPRHQLYTGAWLDESHPLVKYRQERLVLDRALRDSLDAVLTAEQKAAVPGRSQSYARFANWEPFGL